MLHTNMCSHYNPPPDDDEPPMWVLLLALGIPVSFALGLVVVLAVI